MTRRPPLRKSLGQHHLKHGALCRPAIEFLRPEGRIVVEIGPGGGVLTGQLLAAGAGVLAWELDLGWAIELDRRLGDRALRVVVGDALELPWERLAPGTLVAGNLPFAVATPILEGFLERGVGLPRAAFMVQDEVARRLTAEPGSRAYGYLTVAVAALASVQMLGRVAPGSFVPAPKVAGAFIGLERREPAVPLAGMASFRAAVGAAFAHRRKTIMNSIAARYGRPAAVAALERAGLEPGRRAETFSLADFVRLDLALREVTPGSPGPPLGS
jgi:16S rRNA (adenine1518-N6/adenine1519-N6)-dimethyltransferase